MAELDDLKKEKQQLKEEIERISRINSSLIRQIKERSNAVKGQHPKKQHTGYSLVSSVQKEYRYYKSGNHRAVWIFETVFQTPYDISIIYEDVLDVVYDDLYETKNEDRSIIDKLGFSDYFDYKTYPEVYEGDVIRNIKTELIEKYKEQYDTYYVSEEALTKINNYAEKTVRKGCYNLNVRMNGKAGYWEMTINHIEPLASLPPELRFPVKNKNKKNDDNKEEDK